MTNLVNILFTELGPAALEGKAFDGIAPGEYKDMYLRLVEFSEKDFPEYVANTQAAIEATRGESGEIAGLPIDAMNHEKGNAAGWIVGVELVGNIIRFIPRWTSIGRELISEGLQKFFSATVDISEKVVHGGTLTNWPAMRDKAGRIQLRPIELSMSLNEIVSIESDDKELIDMAKKEDKAPDTVEQPEVKQPVPAIDLAALRAEIKADLLAEFQATNDEQEAAERMSEAVKLEAFAEVADLSQAREEMLGQMQAALLAEYNRMQANAGNMLADMMKQIKRDQHVAEFSQRVVSGTEANPRGLPVGQEEVETFLLSLNDEQRAAAESILTRTHEQGLIQFSEYGHGKKLQGVVPFPAEFAGALKSWIADGQPIKEFFAVSPELGEMAQYKLDEYKE